jgi:hypothetical protein
LARADNDDDAAYDLIGVAHDGHKSPIEYETINQRAADAA